MLIIGLPIKVAAIRVALCICMYERGLLIKVVATNYIQWWRYESSQSAINWYGKRFYFVLDLLCLSVIMYLCSFDIVTFIKDREMRSLFITLLRSRLAGSLFGLFMFVLIVVLFFVS